MSSPVRALEAKALLADRLTQPAYQSYMDNFQRSVWEKNAGPVIIDEKGKPSGFYFTKREQVRLGMAEAYFVTDEMMPLVNWAAAGLDETDEFARDLWPTEYGFLYLDEPWIGKEIWGRTTVTKAISWGKIAPGVTDEHGKVYDQGGVLLVHYTDIDDARDEVNTEIREARQRETEAMGTLHVNHISFIPHGEHVGPPTFTIADDVDTERYAKYAVGDMHLTDETPNIKRFLLALLMLLNQTVTEVKKEEADRATARRFRRMGLPSNYTIVRLRRHKNINRLEGETLVEWAHRWIVRGHWRNQPVGENHPDVEKGIARQDADGNWYHRVWISPYVKGPEDKPFKQSEKVYALVR